jgi:2',3'-cyclic-nucleotide 2'-phosphodiesterase (5'-nucleotidase family)
MKRIKLILAAVLVIAVLFTITAPAYAAAVPEGGTTITILHTNDLHGRFVGNETNIIGVDRIAAIHAATANAILVDAGDAIHGMPLVVFSEGMSAIQLMNKAGYRFMVPGNHEFNYGYERLLELAEEAEFNMLAANIAFTATGEPLFDAYDIIEVDGIKVGFFGLSTPETPIRTHPAHVIGLTFGDPVPAAKQAVAALQAAGADVIIAITHLGEDDDEIIAVAEAVEGIHVIIDGHSHTRLDEGRVVGDTLIAQTGAHGAFLGKVVIVVDNGKVSATASLITHEAAWEYEPAAAVTALIAEIESLRREADEVIVGYNPTFLCSLRAFVRTEETPIGNLVADALRWDVDADIAIINSGGIRDGGINGLPAGEITRGDVSAVLQFPNYSVLLEVTAAQLWEALELSVRAPGGNFPAISGFSFVYDSDAPAGARVVSVTVGGVPVARNASATFSLAIPDFLAVGGDGFTVFGDFPTATIHLPVLAEGRILADFFIAYIAEHSMVTAVEGRIVNLAAARAAEVAARIGFLPAPAEGVALTYVVQPGEALWSIAYNYYGSMQGDVVGRIQAANADSIGIDGSVTPGMVLTLPAAGLRDPITRTHLESAELYLVRAGDTLTVLAARFGTTANALFEANGARLRDINTITAGQWIVIP